MILGLLLISTVTALVSTEYGQGVIKGDSVLYKGDVNKVVHIVEDYKPINLTLQQFINKDLETYDFKLKHTNEYIFDVKRSKIFYTYTFVSAIPYATDGEIVGIETVKYEYYEPISYDKFKKCRETKSTSECKSLGEQHTKNSIELKLEKFRTRLIDLQDSVKLQLGETTDDVYDDFVNNLS